jgi:transposase
MSEITVVGVDLAKNSFALVALDAHGKEVRRRTLRRRQWLTYLAQVPPCTVAMEACASAHHWARRLQTLGHTPVLLPPQHVKAYQRGQKNDGNDARAVAEAQRHGAIRPVPIQTVAQQDARMFLNFRRQVLATRTRLVNQTRGALAEYGIVVPRGIAALRRALPEILEDAENELSPAMRALLERQRQRLVELDTEVAWYDAQVEQRVQEEPACGRLLAIPGVGPLVGLALKTWMGDGRQFDRGRAASAALGIVPRQHSTGGRSVLLGISKRGDPWVRALVIHGARAVVSRVTGKDDPLSLWIQRLVATRGFNKAVVALANKIVRMAWVVIARGEAYQPRAAD